MALPDFLLNNQGQRVDSLIAPDGTVLFKLAVDNIALGGLTPHGARQGVATHKANEAAFVASDGIVVGGGIVGANVHPFLVDATGQQLVDVQSRRLNIAPTVQPVASLTAYTAKDAVGGLLTFALAGRAGVLSGLLEKVVIVDDSQQMPQLDLVLFSATFTAPTDNAIFAPSDAELLTCLGVIPIATADWKDFSINSVATVRLAHPYVLAGTSMFGALVTRSTQTFVATTDIRVFISVKTD